MPHSSHSSNLLLASLPPENMAALVPHLRVVQLPQETVLFEAGDTIKAIYLPHTGIVSIVVDLASGEMIETAMIGRDSLVGGSAAVADDDIALNRAVVQVAAVASVVDVGAFRGLVEQSHTFHATMARHRQFILAQAQQSAACNAAHTLEARLSRWLLRCHDLLGSDIPLTQEFLAEMLGARRTSVTLVASTLQRAGFIQYRRGHIG
jgi:CRP-like cAMP-binding protein